jgi:tRNA(fMet)-specific endonuclease VapC
MKRFVLDTNVCLAYIRGNELYKLIDDEHQLNDKDSTVIISVVTKAELFSLGVQNNWGHKKFEILDGLLRKLLIVDINENDTALIDAYVNIDAYSQGQLKTRPSGLSARNMGKNDLWIVATAHVAKASLITTDSDFDHLQNEFAPVFKYPR